jgi:hypothetical protein
MLSILTKYKLQCHIRKVKAWFPQKYTIRSRSCKELKGTNILEFSWNFLTDLGGMEWEREITSMLLSYQTNVFAYMEDSKSKGKNTLKTPPIVSSFLYRQNWKTNACLCDFGKCTKTVPNYTYFFLCDVTNFAKTLYEIFYSIVVYAILHHGVTSVKNK